jgi:hypothetical protein
VDRKARPAVAGRAFLLARLPPGCEGCRSNASSPMRLGFRIEAEAAAGVISLNAPPWHFAFQAKAGARRRGRHLLMRHSDLADT